MTTNRPAGKVDVTGATLLGAWLTALLIVCETASAEVHRAPLQASSDAADGDQLSFSRSTLGAEIASGAKWIGGITGVDGRIYGIPHHNSSILIIDPANQSAATTNMGVNLSVPTESPGGRWSTGALGKDGKIYCVPRSANVILIIDTNTHEAALSDMGVDLSGAQKWMGGVRAPNGKIYGIPMNSEDILVIDPGTGSAIRTDMGVDLSGQSKWSGGVLTPNGKIYCVPRMAKDILVIDPANQSAVRTTMGLDLEPAGFASKWRGGVLGPDGKIYCVPRGVADILIIDPETNTATRSNMGAKLGLDLEARASWRGGVLAQDGRIYCIPRDVTRGILVIDPAANTAEVIDPGIDLSGSNKWSGGGVLGVDGRIYSIPFEADDILIMEVPGRPLNLRTLLSPHRNCL